MEEIEQMCITAIRHYLNATTIPKFTDDYIRTNYPYVIMQMMKKYSHFDENSMLEGATEIREGEQSIKYATPLTKIGITEDIKQLLPRPFIVGS